MNWIKSKAKIIILLLVVVSGVAFFVHRAQAQKNLPKNPSVVKVDAKKEKLVSVQTKTLTEGINLSGKIQAEEFARLQFQSSGKLVYLGVKVGDRVKKYQTLAALDQATLQKQFQKEMKDYLTNRSAFEDTQDKYKPTKDKYLLTDDIRRILDRTQWSLDSSVLDVEIANLAKQNSVLASPIDGVVVEVAQPVNGINVSAGTPFITVVNPNSLYFRSEVDEEDVTKISSGQSSVITLDAFRDQPLGSFIKFISFDSLENNASTVYEVRFSMPSDNSNIRYRLGMNGNVRIISNQKSNVLSVPLEAVFTENNQKYVYKYDESTKQKLKTLVTIGIESDTDVEITSGLSLTDKVVIDDAQN